MAGSESRLAARHEGAGQRTPPPQRRNHTPGFSTPECRGDASVRVIHCCTGLTSLAVFIMALIADTDPLGQPIGNVVLGLNQPTLDISWRL